MFTKRLGSNNCLYAASVALVGAQKAANDDDGAKHTLRSDKRAKIAVEKCRRIVRQKMVEIGTPGIVVGVSVNGKTTWTRGFGYADVENSVPCTPETVMRIASISKSLTMAAVGRLLENGKLDLDKPITEYVPEFPRKSFMGKKVDITTRMLLSHTSGVRHYDKPEDKKKDGTVTPGENTQKKASKVTEFDHKEYYSTKEYKGVIESLEMFKDDDLVHEPGTKYSYTTHGWTLVSAVIERASGEEFLLHIKKMFAELGMKNTFAEMQTDIIYHRARHYSRNENGRLVNTPHVNNSYKWAGGGFISNISDLLKFGNIMLCCYQSANETGKERPAAFLKPHTVKEMWSPLVKPEHQTDRVPDDRAYGMGWQIFPHKIGYAGAGQNDLEVAHTGGAIGASSILYILPLGNEAEKKAKIENVFSDVPPDATENVESLTEMAEPKGIVVTILTNLQDVNLTRLARAIANEFRQAM